MTTSLDHNKILSKGVTMCPETVELQSILNEDKDGIFGIRTDFALKEKFNTDNITLCQVKELGYEVRNEIPNSEIWWFK